MLSGFQRETGVRDQARIVLTSEEGSGRAASSLCNAGQHGSKRRIKAHTIKKAVGGGKTGGANGRCKRLDD